MGQPASQLAALALRVAVAVALPVAAAVAALLASAELAGTKGFGRPAAVLDMGL